MMYNSILAIGEFTRLPACRPAAGEEIYLVQDRIDKEGLVLVEKKN